MKDPCFCPRSAAGANAPGWGWCGKNLGNLSNLRLADEKGIFEAQKREVAEVGVLSNLSILLAGGQKSEYLDFTAAISEAVICSWEIWVMNSG
jgi:hypothetical protein